MREHASSLILRHAQICDGTGEAIYEGALRMDDGIITDVGPAVPSCRGTAELDAGGLLLTPGFIDTHAHSDASVLAAPEMTGKLSQGVTLEISGNCGLSAFPVRTDEVREHLEDLYKRFGIRVSWQDFRTYADAVDQVMPACNTMYLCGHNTLRANVCGYSSAAPAGALDSMKALLAEALEQGCAGLSTGLLYVPGKFASPEEISSLAALGKDRVYATHLRSEGDRILESLEEALAAVPAGGTLLVSHFKVAKERNYPKFNDARILLGNGRKSGKKVFADRYPYTASMTSLSIVLPPPFDAMTDRAIQSELAASPEKAEEVRRKLETDGRAWSKVILCASGDPRVRSLLGLDLRTAAGKRGMTPAQLCTELMVTDAVGTMAAFEGMSPEQTKQILLSEFVCCGTDETALPCGGTFGRCHPRGFGSFPEFFRQVSPECGIAETVRKMTSLPAKIFGLRNRGLLKKGFAADLVLLDPEAFASRATFAEPDRCASGVECVWVNGVLSWDSSRVIRRAGHVLRKYEI